MSLVRELFLIIGFFVVMKLNAVVYSASYYNCQYIPRLYNRTMAGTDLCLESQLTDSSRFKLRDILNEYRRNISMGLKSSSNYSNVFEMRYHWFCEFSAVVVENKSISERLLTKKTKDLLSVLYFIDFQLPSPLTVQPNPGSLDKNILGDNPNSFLSFNDPANYTIFNLALNESTQSKFIDEFIAQIRQTTDPYLTTTGGQRIMGPGTTFFGCSLRFSSSNVTSCLNDTSCFNGTSSSGKLTCVFRTVPEAAPDYKEGAMNRDSCSEAKPRGAFVSDLNLCRDDRHLKDSRRYDMPCQFFYNIPRKQLPVLADTCNGEDPKTNQSFLVPPDGYKCAEIYYNGSVIDFTFGIDSNKAQCEAKKSPSADDSALKLHFASVYAMIVSTALVQKFCL